MFKRTIKGKGKVISNYKTLPRESFLFNRKTHELFLIRLLYPWDKVMEFYVLDDQLVKLGINKMDLNRKKAYLSWYYFDHGSLIYKEENYIAPQDITELKKLYETYRLKAENAKALKFK